MNLTDHASLDRLMQMVVMANASLVNRLAKASGKLKSVKGVRQVSTGESLT